MKKFFGFLIVALISVVSFSSCTIVETEPGHEAVLVDNPLIWGHGGVREYTETPGRTYTWFSAHPIYYNITPIKYKEELQDATSNENTPLDFNISILISINKGEAWKLHKNYGKDWYENNIRDVYTTITREYISKYPTFDLMSNKEILNEINLGIKNSLVAYINNLEKTNGEMPITIVNVVTGRAIPNKPQLDEMNRTSAQIQAKQTQERAYETQIAREKAEKQRAIADKAYQNEMNLTNEQFISLKAWDVIKEKDGANIDVLFDGGTSDKMWNVRR